MVLFAAFFPPAEAHLSMSLLPSLQLSSPPLCVLFVISLLPNSTLPPYPHPPAHIPTFLPAVPPAHLHITPVCSRHPTIQLSLLPSFREPPGLFQGFLASSYSCPIPALFLTFLLSPRLPRSPPALKPIPLSFPSLVPNLSGS